MQVPSRDGLDLLDTSAEVSTEDSEKDHKMDNNNISPTSILSSMWNPITDILAPLPPLPMSSSTSVKMEEENERVSYSTGGITDSQRISSSRSAAEGIGYSYNLMIHYFATFAHNSCSRYLLMTLSSYPLMILLSYPLMILLSYPLMILSHCTLSRHTLRSHWYPNIISSRTRASIIIKIIIIYSWFDRNRQQSNKIIIASFRLTIVWFRIEHHVCVAQWWARPSRQNKPTQCVVASSNPRRIQRRWWQVSYPTITPCLYFTITSLMLRYHHSINSTLLSLHYCHSYFTMTPLMLYTHLIYTYLNHY